MEDESKRSDSYFLYVTTVTATLLSFAAGYTMTWSSPVLQKVINETNSDVNPLGKILTNAEVSLIGSIFCLGAAISPFFFGKLADFLGRKKTLLLLGLPYLIGYIILTFARSVVLYCLARFIVGISVGSSFALIPMYLGEIAEDHNRGRINCMMSILVTLGLLYSLAVGPLMSVKMFNFSCTIPLMLFLIVFALFMPDSPIYLMSIGNQKGAEEALNKLRNKSSNQVEKELLRISQDLERHSDNKGGIGELLKKPPLRKGLIATLGLIIFQQFSGIQFLNSYMGEIFSAAGSPSYESTVVVGVLQIFASIFTSAIVEKFGRKTLLIASTVSCGTFNILLGLYFFLKYQTNCNLDKFFWLPVIFVVAYVISFNLGIGPLPWAVLAEIFPTHVKAIAAALTSFSCFVASFGVTYIFNLIAEKAGQATCFWLFGIFCALCVVFIIFMVPETKGKSLGEIQELLGGK